MQLMLLYRMCRGIVWLPLLCRLYNNSNYTVYIVLRTEERRTEERQFRNIGKKLG